MSNPTQIGELAAAVVQAARLRRELSREQRLELGAATLLAFLIHAHGNEAEDILLAASEAYVKTRTEAYHTAQSALVGLEAIAHVCDQHAVARPYLSNHERQLLSAVRLALTDAANAVESHTRATIPPYETRNA